MCCSLSFSEDDVEEHAKDSKDNARGGQDGVADEEGLVDFSKHLYWCAIGGDTTLKDFKGQREGGEQERKEGNKKGRRKGRERGREKKGRGKIVGYFTVLSQKVSMGAGAQKLKIRVDTYVVKG